MEIREIATHLQQDLIEEPQDKPKTLRRGTELKFVQGFLGDWGFQLPTKGLKTLAARAKSYEDFMRSATK